LVPRLAAARRERGEQGEERISDWRFQILEKELDFRPFGCAQGRHAGLENA